MKNLYKYSPTEQLKSLVFKRTTDAKEVQTGKEKLTGKVKQIEKNLESLNEKSTDRIDLAKLYKSIKEGSGKEVFIERGKEDTKGVKKTIVLKDKSGKEKIKVNKRKLKVKTDKGKFVMRLKDGKVKKNEILQMTPEKEFFKNLTTVENLNTKAEIKAEEKKLLDFYNNLDEATQGKYSKNAGARMTELKERLKKLTELKPTPEKNKKLTEEDKVLKNGPITKETADGKIVKENIDNPKNSNDTETKLTEKKETKEVKTKDSKDAYNKAEKAVGSVDLEGITVDNYGEYKGSIESAKKALKEAKEKCKEHPEDLKKVEALELVLKEREDTLKLYESQSKTLAEYEKDMNMEFKAMDAKIENEITAYEKELEGMEMSDLAIDQVKIEPANPDTPGEIQEGLLQHRTESQKLISEVNFLQQKAGDFATKVAEFEEKKSEFSLANIGKFALSSALIIPGAIADTIAKVSGKKWRTSELLGGGADGIQKEQAEFQKTFDKHTIKLDKNKDALDSYEGVLSGNVEELKTTEPQKIAQKIETGIALNIPRGVDTSKEPWKSNIENIRKDLTDKAEKSVGPVMDQLSNEIQGSLTEVSPNTDVAMSAAFDSADYIKSLNVTPATTMDMSIGFLTKNVAKGLNGVGDVLAKVPVIGVVGGVCRAAGGLVEGVGTIFTDPDKVAGGLGTLFNVFTEEGREKAGDAWSSLGGALIAKDAWEKGEYSAAIGEAAGNAISFIFSGGTAGAVRGAGLAGRVGAMSAKVGSITSRVGTKAAIIAPRATSFIAKTGRSLSRVGRPLGRAGDFALAPLKYGLTGFGLAKRLGGKGARFESTVSRMFTPSKWAKMKPGSEKALKASEKALEKSVKFEKEMTNLRSMYTKAGKYDKIAIKTRLRKLAIKKHAFKKEAYRLANPNTVSTAPSHLWLGMNTPKKVALGMSAPVLPYMATSTAMHTERMTLEKTKEGYESRDQQKLDKATTELKEALEELNNANTLADGAEKDKVVKSAEEVVSEKQKNLKEITTAISAKLKERKKDRDQRVTE